MILGERVAAVVVDAVSIVVYLCISIYCYAAQEKKSHLGKPLHPRNGLPLFFPFFSVLSIRVPLPHLGQDVPAVYLPADADECRREPGFPRLSGTV